MKNLTEFKNRKVVHQELYEDRIILITEHKADNYNPNRYSAFICNKGFDVLSDDTHDGDSESIDSLVATARLTIDRFI